MRGRVAVAHTVVLYLLTLAVPGLGAPRVPTTPFAARATLSI